MRSLLILLLSTISAAAFDIGDVVYLKSGSRPMTVISNPMPGADGVKYVVLQWDNGQSLAGGSLPEASVSLIDPIAVINKKRAADAADAENKP